MDNFLSEKIYNPPIHNKIINHDPLPEFRQLLYWNPNMKIKSTAAVNFYASDWPSDYLVEVSGWGPNGKVSSYSIIKISAE
ncbi:MAG: hypothetical protein HC905_03560 [Bacteroidales bacterium]|nr:hypothetical protein [Bacteroidales bacterium]